MNAASIAEKLKAKGQPMILSRSVGSVYDPITGGLTGGGSVNTTVYGITKSYGAGITNKPDSLIKTGDKQAIVDAVAIVPVPGDTLTIAGEAWQIIAVEDVSPQGATLIYKLQVRK